MRKIIETGLLIYLAAAARKDLKQKTVSVKMAILAGMAAVFLQMIFGWIKSDGIWNGLVTSMTRLAAGVLPGIFLMAEAWITRQAVGYGDGLALCVCGLFAGMEGSLGIFINALFLSALGGIYCLAVFKSGRKKEIPFVPCLLGGYVIWLYAFG